MPKIGPCSNVAFICEVLLANGGWLRDKPLCADYERMFLKGNDC
jgi:hypothetical protein